MAQLTNDALYELLAQWGDPVGDDLFFFAGSPTSQGAGPVKSWMHRIVVNNVANAALTMKSILSLDAPSMVFLINDGAQSCNVFPFAGEKMNGTLNASQAIASLQACAF